MANGFWIAAGIILLVVVWTIAKVIELDRKSRAQWRQVDKDKLKHWDEDDT